MPALLLCSFITASIGLASLAFASILTAHRPSRAAISYLLADFAAWLSVLKVLGGCFYWQTGTSFYVWITGFNHMIGDVSGLLLALACAVLTFPPKRPRAEAAVSAIPFILSCVFFLAVVLAGSYAAKIVPTARVSRSLAVWVCSFAFLALIAIASLAVNWRYWRSGSLFWPIVAVTILAPAFAVAPIAFQVFALEASAVPLIVSLSLSACAFAAFPSFMRHDAPASRSDLAGSEPRLDAILSSREREIASLILDGKTNGEIADALFISRKTVETHLYNMFRKLNVTNRVQLVRRLLSGDK